MTTLTTINAWVVAVDIIHFPGDATRRLAAQPQTQRGGGGNCYQLTQTKVQTVRSISEENSGAAQDTGQKRNEEVHQTSYLRYNITVWKLHHSNKHISIEYVARI
jgi:hypothetical protein